VIKAQRSSTAFGDVTLLYRHHLAEPYL
jgi:hypothetical protein